MGCDIHVHVEVKIKGVWQHYNQPYIHRDYRLFSRMAGVRRKDGDSDFFHTPKGAPSDMSVTTDFDFRKWGGDCHTPSWLSAIEAGNVQRWYATISKQYEHPPLFGYVFGNDIDAYERFPEGDDRIKKMGFEDARIVFWFDN